MALAEEQTSCQFACVYESHSTGTSKACASFAMVSEFPYGVHFRDRTDSLTDTCFEFKCSCVSPRQLRMAFSDSRLEESQH